MSRAATEPAANSAQLEPRSPVDIEAGLASEQNEAETEAMSNSLWDDTSQEDLVDPNPADWSEGDDAVPAEAAVPQDAEQPEAAAATPDLVSDLAAPEPAAPPTSAVASDPLVARLAQLAEQQATLLARLAPAEPAEPQAPAEVDLVAAYNDPNDSAFRDQVMRNLGLDRSNPYAIAMGAALVQAQAAADRAARQEAALEALRQELASKEAAAARASAESALDAAFAAKMATYEAVDADVRDLFHSAARQGVAAGVSPAAALDAVFSKLGKLLRPKTQVAAPAVAKPTAAPRSPAQERLERAAAVSGRAAVRSPTKKNTTAALRALEGGSGWGR